jgi:predicted dinucleotide-binding enzyme
MKIGVIGTGRMGSTIGTQWVRYGHDVCFGSRTPEKAVELAESVGESAKGGSYAAAAEFGDVILMATQWVGVESALNEIRELLDGKILLDCTLPLVNRSLAVDANSSGVQEIARQVPLAKVAKVFSTIDSTHFGHSPFGSPLSAYCCGDDFSAKKMAGQLAHDIGCDPIDTGPLWMAKYVEGLSFLMLFCAAGCEYGNDITFKFMQANAKHKENWWFE